mgnify:CR=1 FL=1
MAISAKDVMELRKQTDCGMMECKKALTQADGKPYRCRGHGLR